MSVQSEITRLGTAKAAIIAAIEGKGVDVPSGAKLSDLAALINSIKVYVPPVTLYIYWESVAGGGWVSLTRNGAAMSVTDFISKMQSGAKIIIGENNDTDSESSGFSNYRYKITDSTTASLAFDVANSFNGSNRTIIISGSSSTDGLMTGYQDIDHDDLSDYSPLPEGSTPASKAWVENYVDTKLADGATPHIGDNGNWYIGDTDTGVSAGGASHIFKVIVVEGTGGPDTLSANKTFAEIKSAYSSGSMVVVQQGSSLYELTYVGNTKVEFTHVNETYCDVLSCTNSGAPQEADVWLLNRTKRINYDTKYGDIGQKTVPVAIKELQDKSAPTVTDSDAGKYLHVNASTKKLEWVEVESGGVSELPAVTAADAGKFLRVSSAGSGVAETVANANGGEF